MSCREIKIDGKFVQSELWNQIREKVGSDSVADSIYEKTVSPDFLEKFGNWVTTPISEELKQKLNSVGEPKFEYIADLLGTGEIPSIKEAKSLLNPKEVITPQVSNVQNAIKNSLPKEVSNAVTVVHDVPLDILGRNDLFLSLKDILNDKGVKDELLINWAGINRVNPKAVQSEQEITNIIEKNYNALKKVDKHPALKTNPLALESFKKWVDALEKYPVAFRDMMLTHAIKYLDPQRRSKYVLQLSDVALTNAYGMVINKPHELNRIGKLYDQEVLRTINEAGEHEPSASGKGYWVHIPRTSNGNHLGYNSYEEAVKGLKELEDDIKKTQELKNKLPIFHSQEPDLIREDANKYGFQDYSFIRVESSYSRGTNPHEKYLGKNYEGYYIHGYNTERGKPDTKIVTITKQQAEELYKKAVERYPDSAYEVGDRQKINNLEFNTQRLNRLKKQFDKLTPEDWNKNSSQYKVNVELLRKLSPSTWCTSSGMAPHYVENYDNYLLVVNGITVAGIEAGDKGSNGKVQVKEVTSRANNGMAPIDHLDDITAFFEKHNIDTDNHSLKRAQEAKNIGKSDKEMLDEHERRMYQEEMYDGGFWEDWHEMEDRGNVDDPGLEYRREIEEEIRIEQLEIANITTAQEALQRIEAGNVVLPHFDLLPALVRDNETLARKAVDYNAHNIAYISPFVPFYNELLTETITRRPQVFQYLPEQVKENRNDLRDIYNEYLFQQHDNIDDLPFSKTNTNKVQGYYDPKNDKVVVVASNTPADEAAKVAIHEVAHRGMVRMAKELGGTKELNKILLNAENELMKKVPELLKRTGHTSIEDLLKDYGFDANTEEGKAKLLTELAARWAETFVNKPKESWWKKFLQAIKEWIKKFTNKVLNEDEVNELVGGFVKYGAKDAKSKSEQTVTPTSRIETPKTKEEVKKDLVNKIISNNTDSLFQPSKTDKNALVIPFLANPARTENQTRAIAKSKMDSLNKEFGGKIATLSSHSDVIAINIKPTEDQLAKEFDKYSQNWYANNSGTITPQGESVIPTFGTSSGLTPAQYVTPTSEPAYKNTNNLTPESFEKSIDKMKDMQNKIELHDLITDPITGQVREHKYTEELPDGTRFIADGSVTSVAVEKKLKNFGSGLPQDDVDKKIAIIASESGTLVHSYAENVWKNILDKDGKLLPDSEFKEDNEPKPSEGVNYRIYNKIQPFIENFAKTFPEGTRFFTEIKAIDKDYKWKERVYDEQTKSYHYEDRVGMGMSADLLVFTPDDVCHIFDYKSTSELEKKKEIPQWKIVAINAQLPEYARILKKEYGIQKFGMMRAIPINLYYAIKPTGKVVDGKKEWTKTLINAAVGNAIGVNREAKSYLDFIPVDQEAAKDKRIDELDKKLKALEESLGSTRTSDINKQEELHRQVATLRKARYNLKLLQDGNNFKAQVEKTIAFAQEYFAQAKNNLLNLSPIDRHNLHDKLNIFANMATTFQGEMEHLSDIIKDKDSTEQQRKEAKALYDNLLEFSFDAQNILKKFDETAIETANKLEIKNIGMNPNLKEKQFTDIQYNLLGQSILPHQMSQLFWMIKSQNISEVKDAMKLFEEKLEGLAEKFRKFTGTTQGKSFYDAIDKYFNSKTTIYTKDFWDQVKEGRNHQNKKGVEQLKKLLEFDQEAYDLAYAKFKESVETSSLSSADQKKRIESYKKRFNVKSGGTNRYAWQNKRNFFLKPKQEFKSAEYNFINDTPELKEVFEGTFKLVHDKAVELGLVKPGTSIFKIFEGIEATDAELSTRGIKAKKSFKERITIKDSELTHLPNIDPLKNEIERKVKGPSFTNAEIPTRNIFEAAKQKMEELLSFEKKIEDEGLILDLITKEQDRKVLQTNKFGISSTENKDIPGITNVTNLKRFKEDVYHYLYGIEPNTKDFVVNVPWVGAVSLKQTLAKGTELFIHSKLGFNPRSFTSNLVGILGHNYIKYGNVLFQSLSKLIGRDKKLLLLMDYFNYSVGHTQDKNSKLTGVPYIKDFGVHNLKDWSMKGMTLTEHAGQAAIFGCWAMTNMFDESGHIVPIREYLLKNSKYKELFSDDTAQARLTELENQLQKETEEYVKKNSIYATVSEKDNEVIFTNPLTGKEENPKETKDEDTINSEKVKAENYIQDEIKEAAGTKDSNDRYGAEGKIAESLLTTFRKWMVRNILNKFGLIAFHPTTGKIREGYWRHFSSQLTKDLAVPMIKHLLNNITGGGFSTSMIKSAKLNYERLKEKATKEGGQFDIHGNPYGMTFEMYTQHHRDLMGRTFRDLGLIVMMLSILAAINALAADEEDADKRYRDIYISRYFQKYYTEFSYWFDPREFQQLLGNSVPVTGLLSDLSKVLKSSYEFALAEVNGDEDALAKAHPTKSLLRLFPAGSTVMDLLSIDPDIREALGTKPGIIRF